VEVLDFEFLKIGRHIARLAEEKIEGAQHPGFARPIGAYEAGVSVELDRFVPDRAKIADVNSFDAHRQSSHVFS
jgi:hypothetical protein